MAKNEKRILNRFISGESCSEEELKILSNWLSDENNQFDIEAFFLNEWEAKTEKETAVKIENIQKKTDALKPEKNQFSILEFKKTMNKYRKIAAVLILPLILFISYYFVNQSKNEIQYFQISTSRGQKKILDLPDGTKVWLNGESMIEYSEAFGKKTREVRMTGETFFEVAENKSIPFIVETGNLKVTVTGTSFNLKAYQDENEVEATLLEGEIELKNSRGEAAKSLKPVKMKPGDSYVFNSETNRFFKSDFNADEINGWKNNQLIFKNDNFITLANKIERWYNVEMIYNAQDLTNESLTVEFFEGEQLSSVLKIVEITFSVKCREVGNKVFVELK